MNIAFVSREFLGLHKNGGIGTAVYHACEHFASSGDFEVHMYYTGRPCLQMVKVARDMRLRGVAVHFVPFFLNFAKGYQQRARNTYRTLRSTEHDVYIFHEFAADGFFCFQAKKQGHAFAHARLGIVTHGSSLWVDEGNGHTAPDMKRRQIYAMEQQSCESADFLVSPSEYLLDWMREKEWELPRITQCIANFNSSPAQAPLLQDVKKNETSAINEVVFFGRLEERKGVRVFCDAINLLPADVLAGKTLVFLGKTAHFNEADIRSLLSPTLERKDITLLFLTHYDSLQARAYLNRDGVLAVMPSLRENSPCVVSECLALGIPFITSSIGGGKELILKEDQERTCLLPEKHILGNRLNSLLTHEGAVAARPATSQQLCYEKWKSLLLG